MGDELPQLLYLQDGVTLKTTTEKFKRYTDLVGSLSIIKQPEYKISINWKPNPCAFTEQLQDWTIVENNTEGNTADSIFQNLSYMLEDILEIETKNKYVTFKDKDDCRTKFYFTHENVDNFIRHVCSHCKTTVAGKNTLRIVAPNVPQKQTNSLSDIHSNFYTIPNNPWGAVGTLVKNLKEKPVETAWVAGTKVYDVIFGHEDISPSPVAAYVNNSNGDGLNTDEYEVVLSKSIPPVKNNSVILPDTSRGHPLTAAEWLSFKDESGRITNVDEVKKIIFRGGVECRIRDEVWKYLLNYYPWDKTYLERLDLLKTKKEEYYIMKKQWKSITPAQQNRFSDFHERKSLVEKDVNRTDRTYEFYAGDDNENLKTLYDILMTYVMYNFDLGYVQGMSDLLSPIYNLLRDEVDAFWCFVGFMEKVQSNFDIDQAGMKHQFQQMSELMKFTDSPLSNYLNDHESANMYFCFRWLLVLFKREFSLADIMSLWEVLWTELPCENFHLLIGVAILVIEKDSLMHKNYEFSNILKHINDLSMNLPLDYIISKAEEIYHIILSRNPPNNIRLILGMEQLDESTLPSHNEALQEIASKQDDHESTEQHNSLTDLSYYDSVDFNYL